MPGAKYLFSKYMRLGNVIWGYSDCLTHVRTWAQLDPSTREKQSGKGWREKKREKQREKERRKKESVYSYTYKHVYIHVISLIRW